MMGAFEGHGMPADLSIEKSIIIDDPYVKKLQDIILFIGLGSFLFHAFGNLWSAFADTLPIMIFILFYLYVAVRFYLEQTNLISIAALIIFLSLNILLGYAGIEEISSYLTALFAMLLISVISLLRGEIEISRGLFITSIIFIISLTFRQVDNIACSYISLGTHWIWHIITAIMLVYLTNSLHDSFSTVSPGQKKVICNLEAQEGA